MKILARSRAELAEALSTLTGRRGVVMTMGAIHEGHLDLVRAALRVCDHVVATVFVNPLQFGPSEDLDAYPRDLEGDFAKLTGAGASVVFAPSVGEMYPHGVPTTSIQPGSAAAPLEGARRPGHFAGVCTVVTKLLGLTRPDVAAFGCKDAQQLAVVRQLVTDLDLPVEILAVPIRREEDGLAMSSRNAYLSEVERQQALALSASLRLAQQAAARGEGADGIAGAACSFLVAAPGVELEYAELVVPSTFEQFPADGVGSALLVLAARVGTTRLIDNAEIEVLAT